MGGRTGGLAELEELVVVVTGAVGFLLVTNRFLNQPTTFPDSSFVVEEVDVGGGGFTAVLREWGEGLAEPAVVAQDDDCTVGAANATSGEGWQEEMGSRRSSGG